MLGGHICRCTGYQGLIDAMMDAAKRIRDGEGRRRAGKQCFALRNPPSHFTCGPAGYAMPNGAIAHRPTPSPHLRPERRGGSERGEHDRRQRNRR